MCLSMIIFYISKILISFLVMAACAIANIVKSSLGPVGLDKMLVDDIGVRIFLDDILNINTIDILEYYINYDLSRMSLLPMMVQPSCVC